MGGCIHTTKAVNNADNCTVFLPPKHETIKDNVKDEIQAEVTPGGGEEHDFGGDIIVDFVAVRPLPKPSEVKILIRVFICHLSANQHRFNRLFPIKIFQKHFEGTHIHKANCPQIKPSNRIFFLIIWSKFLSCKTHLLCWVQCKVQRKFRTDRSFTRDARSESGSIFAPLQKSISARHNISINTSKDVGGVTAINIQRLIFGKLPRETSGIEKI